MPQIYNGHQSPLENFAIHGNPIYPGTGRLAIIGQSKVGTAKYPYRGPYKNPDITGDVNDKYSINHTNALADSNSPYNGKGTNDGVHAGVYQASVNYAGGSTEDINGTPSQGGSGRNQQITLNASLFGYGPSQISGSDYVHPDTSGNKGQVII
jgi:hypothetical protein